MGPRRGTAHIRPRPHAPGTGGGDVRLRPATRTAQRQCYVTRSRCCVSLREHLAWQPITSELLGTLAVEPFSWQQIATRDAATYGEKTAHGLLLRARQQQQRTVRRR